MDTIKESLYTTYLPFVILSMCLQLALTLTMLRLCRGMAGSDVDLDNEAQSLYCRLLNYPYSWVMKVVLPARPAHFSDQRNGYRPVHRHDRSE